jgi:predicted glycogen debranching enzyme
MISFGREITGDFSLAARREWLLTDGLGGWASGTVSGANTRRYHGLFIPALAPPLGRTVLVTKFNEWATREQDRYPLSANEYADGTIHPDGFIHLESFHLEQGLPVWTYALRDLQIEKRIWLGQGHAAAYVAYRYRRGTRPVTLEITPMVAARDSHGETSSAGWTPDVQACDGGIHIRAGSREFWIKTTGGSYSYDPSCCWHWGIKHRLETERGLPDREDQFAAGTFRIILDPDASPYVIFAMTLDGASPPPKLPSRSEAQGTAAGGQPEWIRQLSHAAAQFLVKRARGTTVIAGYHWFEDWGRDTMIALPGLCLTTGRVAEAASILRTWGTLVRDGLLPNRITDGNAQPDYNTADAALWYVHAIDRYVSITDDQALIRDLWPVLEDIMSRHLRGTRFGIHADQTDGLLYAGEPGVAVTWMDAKIGDWVVTPRIGKPVEINALWVNALRVMEKLALRLRTAPAHDYSLLAKRAASSFDRYWNPMTGCLFDVLDGPAGHDPAIRPNQLFAVSLPHAPVDADSPRAKAIVNVCAEHLLTSYGLRSLSPEDPAYVGVYTGDRQARDSAYHQGTVWAWLIGPFVDAHVRVHRDPALARSFLLPFEQHLADYGLGSIAELFDGNPPHCPRGGIAQAWSVAEVLRAWMLLAGEVKRKKSKGKSEAAIKRKRPTES